MNEELIETAKWQAWHLASTGYHEDSEIIHQLVSELEKIQEELERKDRELRMRSANWERQM